MATGCQRNESGSMRGGARKGAGRKPGLGETKVDKNIALTPTLWAFLMSGGNSAGHEIETRLRKSAAFKAWLKNQAAE
jgi:hypothetical protein